MTRLIAALAVTMSLTALAADSTKTVEGKWKSEAAEDMGNGAFVTREFKLTNKTWDLVFTIWADKELKTPLVAMNFSGPWKETGDSRGVPGAHEATFEFAKKTITLKAKDAAKGFGMDQCGLEVGKAKDVTRTGCSFVASVEHYGKEFDLIKRDGDKLFFGARPADNNMGSEDKRPTTLGAALARAK